jgi:hypothetical protein
MIVIEECVLNLPAIFINIVLQDSKVRWYAMACQCSRLQPVVVVLKCNGPSPMHPLQKRECLTRQSSMVGVIKVCDVMLLWGFHNVFRKCYRTHGGVNMPRVPGMWFSSFQRNSSNLITFWKTKCFGYDLKWQKMIFFLLGWGIFLLFLTSFPLISE